MKKFEKNVLKDFKLAFLLVDSADYTLKNNLPIFHQNEKELNIVDIKDNNKFVFNL